MCNVLEHHFDRHENCGPWCPKIKWRDEPEQLEKLCYRDKDKDKSTYLQLRKIRDPFFTLEKLEELRHGHDTNKCENMMRVIMKFHPKDMRLYDTVCCRARIYTAVAKDSIGMHQYLVRIFKKLGIEMLETTKEYGIQKDYERTYNTMYQKDPKN